MLPCVTHTQAMLPPPAAAAMEGLDMKKAMAILIAMDPNKAADMLTGARARPAPATCCES
jgi:flagellar motility protein MotE (MotC chaperone)